MALYLSLLWVAGGYPHETQRPARFWAELLGLPDPEGAGSRVIRSTWNELASRNLVAIAPGGHAGDIPTIRPLREDGSRRAYTIPEGRGGDTYRRVPESAWRQLFHDADLTGAGLAMYLVALRTAQQIGRTHRLTFPPSYFKEQYGLGESTRKAGLANLVDLGVLDVHIERIDATGEGVERLRRRNVYDLLDEYARPREALERPLDPSLVGRPR